MTETKRWKPSLFLCFCFLRSIIAFHLPSAPAPSTHSIQEAPSLPILTFSVTLIFIHLILHHLCLLWRALLLLQNSSYWLSKDAFILIVFDFSFSFVPLFPFPFPLNPWERFGTCLSPSLSLHVPFLTPTLFSVCTSLKPRFQQRPRHIDPSTWWAAVPEDHVLIHSYGLYNLSIYWKDGTCQASINFLLDVNFLTEIRYFDETFLLRNMHQTLLSHSQERHSVKLDRKIAELDQEVFVVRYFDVWEQCCEYLLYALWFRREGVWTSDHIQFFLKLLSDGAGAWSSNHLIPFLPKGITRFEQSMIYQQ